MQEAVRKSFAPPLFCRCKSLACCNEVIRPTARPSRCVHGQKTISRNLLRSRQPLATRRLYHKTATPTQGATRPLPRLPGHEVTRSPFSSEGDNTARHAAMRWDGTRQHKGATRSRKASSYSPQRGATQPLPRQPCHEVTRSSHSNEGDNTARPAAMIWDNTRRHKGQHGKTVAGTKANNIRARPPKALHSSKGSPCAPP